MNKGIVASDMEFIAKGFGRPGVFKGKAILITGCAGFLGFYFVHFFKYLMDKGINIKSLILLDNFIVGTPDWLNGFKGNKKIHIHNFDIVKDDIGKINDSKQADYVIHLASIASPAFYRKFPLETLDANVWGLRNLLDFYRQRHLQGLLFFSSSEVYGDPSAKNIPTKEEFRGNVSCVGPRSCYDESKRLGETLCYIYANKYFMPISVVRPFNNYGPGMRLQDKRAPADFAKAIIDNKDIVMFSDGAATRTFCYVADAVVGYLKALTYGRYDYFNIGIDSPEISIKELALLYKKIGKKFLGYNGRVLFRKSADRHYTTDNPLRRCPDIKKSKSLLGFSARIKVKEGVERYLKYLIETEAGK